VLISRAMLIACFMALGWLAVLVAALLFVLAAMQFGRGEAEAQPLQTVAAGLAALAGAALCRWAAGKVERLG
jgi:hypothetical protein